MDGHGGNGTAEYVGVHSEDRMDQDYEGPTSDRTLFYPWRYLSTEAIIEYWAPDGTIYPAGWSRGLGGRHSYFYRTAVHGNPGRETVAMRQPVLQVQDRWIPGVTPPISKGHWTRGGADTRSPLEDLRADYER